MLRDSKIKMIKSEPMTLLTFAYLPLLHYVTYLCLLTPTSLRYLPLLTYTYFIALLTLLAPTSLRYLP